MTRSEGGAAPDANIGLQPQRSALAWSRTSIAALGSGALILTRDTGRVTGVVLAGFAIAIAMTTAIIGQRRRAVLAQHPLPTLLAASVQVRLLGWSSVALCVLTLILLILPMSPDPG